MISFHRVEDLQEHFVESWRYEPTLSSTTNIQLCAYRDGKDVKEIRVRKDWMRIVNDFRIYKGMLISTKLSVRIHGEKSPRDVEQIKPKTSTHTPLLIGKVVKTLGTRHITYIHFNTHTTHTQNKTTNKSTIITTTNKKIKKAHFLFHSSYIHFACTYKDRRVCVCV